MMADTASPAFAVVLGEPGKAVLCATYVRHHPPKSIGIGQHGLNARIVTGKLILMGEVSPEARSALEAIADDNGQIPYLTVDGDGKEIGLSLVPVERVPN